MNMISYNSMSITDNSYSVSHKVSKQRTLYRSYRYYIQRHTML